MAKPNYSQRRQQWKYHLAHLPTIESIRRWKAKSDLACVLIPLFSFDGKTNHIKSYAAKAASWSLKTWLENSDASEYGIPCYIYVERNIAKDAVPILVENQVPQENIMIAEYSNTAWLAKCLQPIFDESLDSYEYLVISDSDMFCVKGSGKRVLPLFEKINVNRPEGFGCTIFNEPLPSYWSPYFKDLYEYKHEAKFKGDLIEKWGRALEVLTQQELMRFITGKEKDDRPWTGAMVIENGIFTDKDWFQLVCETLGDDEAAMYAWSKVSEKNTLWDLKTIDIACYTDMISYVLACYDVEAKRMGRLNDLQFETIDIHKPCLLHHFASVDHKFYKALGIT